MDLSFDLPAKRNICEIIPSIENYCQNLKELSLDHFKNKISISLNPILFDYELIKNFIIATPQMPDLRSIHDETRIQYIKNYEDFKIMRNDEYTIYCIQYGTPNTYANCVGHNSDSHSYCVYLTNYSKIYTVHYPPSMSYAMPELRCVKFNYWLPADYIILINKLRPQNIIDLIKFIKDNLFNRIFVPNYLCDIEAENQKIRDYIDNYNNNNIQLAIKKLNMLKIDFDNIIDEQIKLQNKKEKLKLFEEKIILEMQKLKIEINNN